MKMTIRNILLQNEIDRVKPFTYTQLAKRSQVSATTIHKIKNGKYDGTNYDTIAAVFAALGYSIDIDVKKIK